MMFPTYTPFKRLVSEPAGGSPTQQVLIALAK